MAFENEKKMKSEILKKIPSEMLRLLTLWTLFILLKLLYTALMVAGRNYVAEIATIGYVVDWADWAERGNGTDRTDVAEMALCMNVLLYIDCQGS